MKYTRELMNGFIIFLGIGIYFIILELLGISDVFIMRLFNIFIIGYGVNRTLKANVADGVRGYFRNFLSGVMTSMIGALLSILALFIYVESRGGEPYLKTLAEAFIIGGGDIDSYQYAIAMLLFESTAGTLIVCFCLMQYYKDKVEVINKID
jgi:hypothetical protein